MNDDELAMTQATLLLAHALAYDEDSYIAQLEQLGNPHLVVNEMCRMLARTIDPRDHAEFSQNLLSSVQHGLGRYRK